MKVEWYCNRNRRRSRHISRVSNLQETKRSNIRLHQWKYHVIFWVFFRSHLVFTEMCLTWKVIGCQEGNQGPQFFLSSPSLQLTRVVRKNRRLREMVKKKDSLIWIEKTKMATHESGCGGQFAVWEKIRASAVIDFNQLHWRLFVLQWNDPVRDPRLVEKRSLPWTRPPPFPSVRISLCPFEIGFESLIRTWLFWASAKVSTTKKCHFVQDPRLYWYHDRCHGDALYRFTCSGSLFFLVGVDFFSHTGGGGFPSSIPLSDQRPTGNVSSSH